MHNGGFGDILEFREVPARVSAERGAPCGCRTQFVVSKGLCAESCSFRCVWADIGVRQPLWVNAICPWVTPSCPTRYFHLSSRKTTLNRSAGAQHFVRITPHTERIERTRRKGCRPLHVDVNCICPRFGPNPCWEVYN